MRTTLLRTALIVAALSLGWQPARAQCLDWRTFPHVGPELGGTVNALVIHDDGSGPALYVGGDLTLPASASPTTHVGLVRWDGTSFSTIPGFPAGTVLDLLSYDDGSGSALYVTQSLPNNVLKWDGTQWHVIGVVTGTTTFTALHGLAVHDDGTGPAVYVCGSFTAISGVPATQVAKWDGNGWSALGAGPSVTSPFPTFVRGMTSFDDGSGPALFAVGKFPGVAGAGSPNISKWQGGTWSGVGSGANASMLDLVAWDDGHGPALFVVGEFTSPGFHVARWNGSVWSAVGGGIGPATNRLALLDEGIGPRLYVSSLGSITSVHGRIDRWDGSSWTQIGLNPTNAFVSCGSGAYGATEMIVFDEGDGPHLIASTPSGGLGNVLSVLSRHTGTEWERLGPPLRGLNGSLRALAVHDDGSGPALYAGSFAGLCQADETSVVNVARWDGTTWNTVGNELKKPVSALAPYSGPSGSSLFAACQSSNFGSSEAVLFQWTGGFYWNLVGSSTQDGDLYFALHQFGPYLYVGGSFFEFNTQSTNIQRWHPSTGLREIGPPLSSNVNGAVNALMTFDDGSGLALYAGGTFTLAGTLAVNRVARWNGASWSAVGSGMNSLVDAFAVHDDGTGPALYAGGTFTTAGGLPASCVARWNGSSWSAVGAGLNAQVLTLEVFDDGSGPALYAGGNFTASGNVPMERIARWNGTIWSGVAGGTDGTIWSLKSHDDGTGIGPQLFAGGTFRSAGTLPSAYIAAWRGCGDATITKHCFGDGSSGACPCGNQGLSARGCDNSLATGGARLNATGTTSPDTIVLHAAGELPNAATLVFQGANALSQPLAFGDGFRCVGGSIQRLYTTNAFNGAVTVPGTGQPSISARSALLGVPLSPGTVKSYQAWYRDPNLAFCTPPSGNAWNLSNAVRIVW